jgi:hypothetical protein
VDVLHLPDVSDAVFLEMEQETSDVVPVCLACMGGKTALQKDVAEEAVEQSFKSGL